MDELAMTAAAQLIRGQVFHERLRPTLHRFLYPIFCLRLNVERLHDIKVFGFGVNVRRPLMLRTQDYGPKNGGDLALWMRGILAEHNIDAAGDIYLQTFPRIFGFVFNPVSFWYCHDQEGGLRAVLAEVNNTFGETHRYLIATETVACIESLTRIECLKMMHVSPFCLVHGHYEFRFQESASKTWVSIDYFDEQGLLIKTGVGGQITPLSTKNLWRAFLGQPFLTVGVFLRIHLQAFKLWRKRVPFFRQPAAPTSPLTVAKGRPTAPTPSQPASDEIDPTSL
jgi:DUF1365 family protein